MKRSWTQKTQNSAEDTETQVQRHVQQGPLDAGAALDRFLGESGGRARITAARGGLASGERPLRAVARPLLRNSSFFCAFCDQRFSAMSTLAITFMAGGVE